MGGRGAPSPDLPEQLRIALPQPEPGSGRVLPPDPDTYQYVTISNRDLPPELPRGWSMDELAERVTPRTRIVAVSHVQFTSGFAADLPALGGFCRERGIDLVVDVAQSLGHLPRLDPRQHRQLAGAAASEVLVQRHADRLGRRDTVIHLGFFRLVALLVSLGAAALIAVD